MFNWFNLITQYQIRLLVQGHVCLWSPTFLLLQAKIIYSTAKQLMGSHVSALQAVQHFSDLVFIGATHTHNLPVTAPSVPRMPVLLLSVPLISHRGLVLPR